MNVSKAILEAGVRVVDFCAAWKVVRPVLQKLVDGSNFIVRLIGRVLLTAVDTYVEERCN